MTDAAARLTGSIAPGVVPAVLREVYLQRETGLLRFIRPGERCSLRFVQGHIVYGEASRTALHLGEVMVTTGLLSPALLERATGIVVREHRRLGEVLLGLGILDEAQLHDVLALHVREILVHVFGWKDGTHTFERQPPDVRSRYDFPLAASTGQMILDAVRRVEDLEVVRYALGDLDRVVLPATDPLLRFQRVTLTPIEGLVLSRVDGTLTARDILGVALLPPEAVLRGLFALMCTGIVELSTPRAPAPDGPASLRQEILSLHERMPGLGDHEVLGLPPTASEADIKAAFFRLAKRYHPDVHHEAGLTDLREKLEAIFFRLTTAFHALSGPAVRPPG